MNFYLIHGQVTLSIRVALLAEDQERAISILGDEIGELLPDGVGDDLDLSPLTVELVEEDEDDGEGDE